MSSNSVIIVNLPAINGQLTSSNNNLNNFYSPSPNLSPSSSSSSSSSPSSNKNPVNSSSNPRKDSSLKLPYPVLSDHRDLSSILILLQKETQTTSKKISHVIKQIEEYERRLTSNIYTETEKKTWKYERVKFKQQLDALKKHERRVSLQIDFITTKNEIKGLEEEQQSNESQQIKILVGKLKQKLDKMRIYMRTRNEQMKKITNGKQHGNDKRKSTNQNQPILHSLSSSSGKDANRKRSSTSTSDSDLTKRLKSTTPVIRLTSRVTSHDAKEQPIQPLIGRFSEKIIDTKINSTSPTTPVSSSTTSSPLLMINTSISKRRNTGPNGKLPLVDDDDNELDLELDMDELFNDDLYSEQTVQNFNTDLTHHHHQQLT